MNRFMLCFTLLLSCMALGALTGFGTTPVITLDTVAPVLELNVPNGGEQWYIGDAHDILWSGTDTNPLANPINIWYSLNGGAGYTSLIMGTANDGIHNWLPPLTQTSAGKVKISMADAFGHVTEDASTTAFSITYAPPRAPQNMEITRTGNYNILLDWDPVTQTIYNTPVVPDGYLVFNSEYPNDEDDYAFLWYLTADTNFTHNNVARFSDRMFYRVVAYKDFGGRLAQYLATSSSNPDRILTWKDIKSELLSQYGGVR